LQVQLTRCLVCAGFAHGELLSLMAKKVTKESHP